MTKSPELEEGIVISSHRNRVLILDGAQQPLVCVIRHGKDRAVAGDRVGWQRISSTEGRVIKILPRHSLVYRPTEHGSGKPIAANVDRLVLLIAPVPVYLPRLIDRALVIAAYLDIPACLVFNKIDLLDEAALRQVKTDLALYDAIGIPVFWVSAKTSQGVDGLARFLQSQNSILVGQSGVGKSSLTKVMTTGTDVVVQDLSSRGAVGRHTTSNTTLYPLVNGGWILDSPGVREFALWQIPPGDIASGFLEFRPFLGQCRFRDCRHDVEPGCAVTEAVDQGSISPQRLESYREMIKN